MVSKAQGFWGVSLLGSGLLLGLTATGALADPPVSTTLSNGAALDVQILSPSTSTEFKVPANQSTIDVDVNGTASVGLGEPDATLIYVIDVSGSTGGGSGTGCSPILQCEQQFFIALNTAAINDGSTDLVGIAAYESTSSIALNLTAPTDPAVNTTINGLTPLGATNCAAGLNDAQTLVTSGSNTNGTSIVVFASDGLCNTGGAGSVSAAATALGATGAIVHSVAIGTGSNCTSDGGTGTLGQIPQNGGSCTEVPDPGMLPNIIQNLIGSSLDLLEIQADVGAFAAIPNAQISTPLPAPGAVMVTYGIVNPTTVMNLAPADHTISVRATGSDVLGDVQMVTDSHTIHLLQLTATPALEVNDLNFDDEHTVTAEIVGGTGPDRNIDFVVGGQNAATATPPNASILASVNTPVDFVYTVPQDCASLGTDTITVSTVIAGMPDAIVLQKEWVDEVPPEVSCDPTINPHGNQQPPAPGGGGQGQNQDGFYQLNAEDPNLANCTVTLQVTDGDGFVFPGPFSPGDNIKYTEDNTLPQEQKTIGSTQGSAGAVVWHLIGHGDLTVTGTDPSGNSASATCLVPQPPK